jgi:acyl carrier protein
VPAETHVERAPIGPEEVLALVRDRIVELLGVDEAAVTLDSELVADLHADGLAVIELVESLEDELAERSVGLAFDDDEIADLRTVRDVVELVVAGLTGRD